MNTTGFRPPSQQTAPRPLRVLDAFASDPLLLDDPSALYLGRMAREENDLTLQGAGGALIRLQGFFDCDPRPTLVSEMGACFGPIVVARLLHAMKLVPGNRDTRTDVGAAVLASEGSVRRLGTTGGRANVRPGMVLIAGEGIDLGQRARLVCALAPGVTIAVSGPARIMIRGHRTETRDRSRMVPFDLIYGTAAIDISAHSGLRTQVPIWTPAGRFDLSHGRFVAFATDDALVRLGAIGGGRVGVVNGTQDIADDLRDQMIQVPGFFAPVDGPHKMAHPEKHRDIAAVLELLNALTRQDKPRADSRAAEQALAPEPDDAQAAKPQNTDAAQYLARALQAARTVDRAGLDPMHQPAPAPHAAPQPSATIRSFSQDGLRDRQDGFQNRSQAPTPSQDPGFGAGFGFSGSSSSPLQSSPSDGFAAARPTRPRFAPQDDPDQLFHATGGTAGVPGDDDLFHGGVAPDQRGPSTRGLYQAQPEDVTQRRVFLDAGAPDPTPDWAQSGDPAMQNLAGIFAADLDRQAGNQTDAPEISGGSDFDPFLGDALGLSHQEFGFGIQGTLPPDRFFRANRAFDGTPQDIAGGRAVSGIAVYDCEDGFDGCEVHYIEDASRASAANCQRLAKLDGVKARHMNPGNFVLKP